MSPSVGVVVFPGSNCEQDVAVASRNLGAEPVMVWHGDDALPDVDIVVLPAESFAGVEKALEADKALSAAESRERIAEMVTRRYTAPAKAGD